MRETGGFSGILTRLRRGNTDLEIMDALKAVVYAVATTGKAGRLTLNLKILPQGEGRIDIETEIKSAIPVAQAATPFYVDENGNLSTRDPRQAELPLREETASERATRVS